jgi:ABC-type antimicrobial peptide transport system permease subunit
MSIFGLLAVLIGAAGIYAVMAFVVAQQTREIGVRMALGATGRRVLVDVLRETSRHLLAGLALGLIAAWMMSGAVASLLFGVRPTEAFVYIIVAATLVAVGLAAALVPARRASRVDPIVSLRAE